MVQVFGAGLAFLGVALGAFGAHILKQRLLANGNWDVWHTAVYYQLFHALALLILAGRASRGPVYCLLWGTFFFSGSLYLLATNPGQTWAGPITPLGGMLLLVGWSWLIVQLLRTKD